MKIKNGAKQFVICIDNSEYPASLELHKIYAVMPDERAAEDDFLRVIDESGEDYLYSSKRFVPIELPQLVKRSVIRAVHETTKMANTALQPPSRARRKSNTRKSSRATRG